MELEDQFPVYPEYSDPNFDDKILSLKEFNDVINGPYIFPNGLYKHQEFCRRYMSPHTPYNRVILNFLPGRGKTRMAMSLINEYSKVQGMKPAIYLMHSDKNIPAIDKEYEIYFGKMKNKKRSDHGANIAKTKFQKKFLITKTYKTLNNELIKYERNNEWDIMIKEYSNRVIIYDEMHHLRKSKAQKISYEYMKKFSHSLQDTGNIHIGLTANIMVNLPTEIASVVNIISPDVDINEKKIEEIYNIYLKPEKAVNILSKYINYTDDVYDLSKYEELYELGETKDMEEYKKEKKKVIKIVKEILYNYLKPKLTGRIMKVDKIKGYPKEILKGVTYNLDGIDTNIYPCEMSDFQKENYENELDERSSIGENLRRTLRFSYPLIAIHSNGKKELTFDRKEYDEEWKIRRSTFDDIIKMKGLVSINQYDRTNKTLPTSQFTEIAKKFFLGGNKKENMKILKKCSIYFYEALRILEKNKKLNQQSYVYLFYLDEIRLFSTFLKELYGYERYYGRFKKTRTGILNPIPPDLYKKYMILKNKKSLNYNENREYIKIKNDIKKYNLPKDRFTVITGETTTADTNNIIKSINMKENIYGDFIRILIGSDASGESINILQGRNVIKNATWNDSTDVQIKSRTLRLNSQRYFKPEDRFVNIYNMATVYKDFDQNLSNEDFYTYDIKMYRDSQKKGIMINIANEIIAETSVARYLEDNVYVKDINITSYLSYYKTNIVNKIKPHIFYYLSIIPYLKIPLFLQKYPDFDEKEVRIVLLYLLNSNTLIRNRFGYNTYLKEKNDVYYLQDKYVYGNNQNYLEYFYSDKLFINDKLDINTIIEEDISYEIKDFVSNIEDEDDFTNKYLESDKNFKISLFEKSFLSDFLPQKYKDILYNITKNLYFIFEKDNVIVHIMNKSSNYNYTGNSIKINSSDQIIRSLYYNDENRKWRNEDPYISSKYINEINKRLMAISRKFETKDVYGIYSVIDSTFRLCNTKKSTKTKQNGDIDKRTRCRGFICNTTNFKSYIIFLLKLNIKPPYIIDISDDKINKISDQYQSYFEENNYPNYDKNMLAQWTQKQNKQVSCDTLFYYLDDRNLIFYK